MGAFEFTALNDRGKEKRGVIEGDSARQVRQQLREQGLTPLNVEPVVAKETPGSGRPVIRRGISATDLALITRQLATLSRAGMPLEEALNTVARQAERGSMKSMLLAVRSRVLEGHSLAAGLADFPNAFPELYRATVDAGEQSGHLDAVLERLADYTENRQQMRQKIQLALFYPALLTTFALLVTIALLTYVVPQVVDVFTSINQQLPWLTLALISVSDFLRDFGLYLLLLLVIAVTAFRRLMRGYAFRLQVHRTLHRVPLVARILRGMNTARFARTFSILGGSGVPILSAMRISAEVLSSLPMREAVEEAAQRVREGVGIARALEKSGYFPPMTLHLIASGESSGRLEDMLDRAATNQERELETVIAAVMGLFEPLLILLMGGLVLIIVLAILMPIFELNQLVQ